MSGHCLRRWSKSETTLRECLCSLGICRCRPIMYAPGAASQQLEAYISLIVIYGLAPPLPKIRGYSFIFTSTTTIPYIFLTFFIFFQTFMIVTFLKTTGKSKLNTYQVCIDRTTESCFLSAIRAFFHRKHDTLTQCSSKVGPQSSNGIPILNRP